MAGKRLLIGETASSMADLRSLQAKVPTNDCKRAVLGAPTLTYPWLQRAQLGLLVFEPANQLSAISEASAGRHCSIDLFPRRHSNCCDDHRRVAPFVRFGSVADLTMIR